MSFLLVKASNSTRPHHIYTMQIFPGACIKISLCSRMSLVSKLHHKDRSAPSSCRITCFVSFVNFYFFTFAFFSIVTKFVVFYLDSERLLSVCPFVGMLVTNKKNGILFQKIIYYFLPRSLWFYLLTLLTYGMVGEAVRMDWLPKEGRSTKPSHSLSHHSS